MSKHVPENLTLQIWRHLDSFQHHHVKLSKVNLTLKICTILFWSLLTKTGWLAWLTVKDWWEFIQKRQKNEDYHSFTSIKRNPRIKFAWLNTIIFLGDCNEMMAAKERANFPTKRVVLSLCKSWLGSSLCCWDPGLWTKQLFGWLTCWLPQWVSIVRVPCTDTQHACCKARYIPSTVQDAMSATHNTLLLVYFYVN